MTEKLARRGARVPSEYAADYLESVLARDAMSTDVVTLDADDTVEATRAWFASGEDDAAHQGYPVLDGDRLIGVLTRRNLQPDGLAPQAKLRDLVKRAPVIATDGTSLREVADRMTRADVGRIPIVSAEQPTKLVGIVTRSDLLGAHKERLDAGVPQSTRLPIVRKITMRKTA
jgi:CBS domain-containing protein